MNTSAEMRYRNDLYIKEVYCCGCFFDKLYYIFNSKDLIEYDTFEKGFIAVEGYFKDFIFDTVVIVCNDILSFMLQEGGLMKLHRYYSFHICSVFKKTKLLYEFKLAR